VNEIERLRALLAEATPGPWHAHRQPTGTPWWIESEDEHGVADVERAEDAALIAAAVNALAALLNVAEATRFDHSTHRLIDCLGCAALVRLDGAS
jgi:hypothetical protein